MPHGRRPHALRDRRGGAVSAALTRPGPRVPPALQAVFLDRDGTLNVKADEGDYITRAADLELLPGAAYAVRRLNDVGVPVFVVTNQRGVARGRMSERDLDVVHARLADLLAEAGASVDGIYSCTHGHGACDCRKPLPGLLHRAAAEHALDLARCAMVGDAASDVAAGRAAGCRSVRLAPVADPVADLTVPTLQDAVEQLLVGLRPSEAGRLSLLR